MYSQKKKRQTNIEIQQRYSILVSKFHTINSLWLPWIQNMKPLTQELPCYSLKSLPIPWCTLAGLLCSEHPILMCVFVGFPTPLTSNAQTPAGCQGSILTLFIPGDSIRFHRLRAQSYKTAPSPCFRCQLQAYASDKLATKWRFQQPPPTQGASPKSRLSPVLLTDWL